MYLFIKNTSIEIKKLIILKLINIYYLRSLLNIRKICNYKIIDIPIFEKSNFPYVVLC